MYKRKRYIMAFAVIVLAWAIGIGGLVVWQTTREQKIVKTKATEITPYVPNDSTQSKFGELLEK